MDSYEINRDTYAIMPFGENKSEIIEKDKTFIVDIPPLKVIDASCKYFGSSYQGRFSGTKGLIGISHKAPIIIEETREIIFFPTKSTRIIDCGWISLKNLSKYMRDNNNSLVIFNNGLKLNLNISYGTLDNQVLRATRLESVLRLRKSNNKDE